MNILIWLVNNIFAEPTILLGMIVMIGLISQNKNFSDTFIGMIKAMLGFLIISEGAGIIVRALLIFQPVWATVFNLDPQQLKSFMGQEAFNTQFGSAITLSMTLGFVINVLLARITPLKYIYLTGHMMFWTTTIFAGVIVNANPDISFTSLVLFLSILMGLYWTIQPAIAQPFMNKITSNANLALGHTSASVAVLGALVGKVVGIGSRDSEDLQVPTSLSFLRESNVITALVMGFLFITGAAILFIKPQTEQITEIFKASGSMNFILYVIKQSLIFTAGIAVTLFGVRMFIGEMIPAFKGFSDKFAPEAKPALDCPLVFSYAPNAVILGFLGAFLGGLFWMIILGNTIGYVFVPSMIVLFFHGATAGVFGNSTGGIRGAIIAGFLTATIVAVGQWFTVTYLLNNTIPDTALWAADSDMFLLAPAISFLAKFLP